MQTAACFNDLGMTSVSSTTEEKEVKMSSESTCKVVEQVVFQSPEADWWGKDHMTGGRWLDRNKWSQEGDTVEESQNLHHNALETDERFNMRSLTTINFQKNAHL